MVILTKKRQEQIIKLLCESGTVLTEDIKVSPKTFSKVDENNFAIAELVSGFKGVTKYHDVIESVCQRELEKLGGNDHEQNYQGNT